MPAKQSPTAQPRKRGGCGCIGVLAVFVVIIVVITAGTGSKSKSLPPGQWGKTISCLEGHPLFLVTDGHSSSAAAPHKHTTEVVINSQLHGYELTTIDHTASHAAAEAVKRDNGLSGLTRNYNISGSTVWVWNEGGNGALPHVLASALDQDNIDTCITDG